MHDLSAAIAALAAPIPASASEIVVVFRTDKIGDLIVTSPLFRAIKASRPNAYVILIAAPYNRDVLANMAEIDRIIIFDERAAFGEKLGFALALRQLKPCAVFVMSPKPDGYWIARLSGARWRAGVVMTYHTLQLLTAPLMLNAVRVINRAKLDRSPDHSFHVSEIALRLAERCGFGRPADITQSCPTTQAERDWATAAAPSPRILLHLGGTWAVCGLNDAALANLAARIEAEFPAATLVMTAGPADQSTCEAVRTRLPNALVFSGLSFGHWNALIESAALVVTPDTGAVHIASAHQRPVVAVYVDGRHNAMTSLFGPWKTPHRTLRGGADSERLQTEIIAAMHELLA